MAVAARVGDEPASLVRRSDRMSSDLEGLTPPSFLVEVLAKGCLCEGPHGNAAKQHIRARGS